MVTFLHAPLGDSDKNSVLVVSSRHVNENAYLEGLLQTYVCVCSIGQLGVMN
jgi:hypothetical protein